MTLPSTMIGTPPGRGEHAGQRRGRGRLVDHLHEYACRAAIGGRGPRFADGDVHARVLRVLHALEVHEVAVRIDDRDGDVPAVLRALGEDSSSNLLRRGSDDRRAVLRTTILRQVSRGRESARPNANFLIIFLSSSGKWWERDYTAAAAYTSSSKQALMAGHSMPTSLKSKHSALILRLTQVTSDASTALRPGARHKHRTPRVRARSCGGGLSGRTG